MLLQRPGADRSLEDFEGYTAFDLYNSTLNGTKPSLDALCADLYTWGINKYIAILRVTELILNISHRNAALGLGDAGDRAHPDQVVIAKREESSALEMRELSRFFPIHVRQIQMSKLHTGTML